MRVITFYSYKGGVGRTLAAANFAVYLAKLGQRTVIIDFDLEAPGIDSKFLGFELPANQQGILDYVISFQRSNTDPGSVKEICVEVPLGPAGGTAPLTLIPAGSYMASRYYADLNELDWSLIFSEREGVAFFQSFLARIQEELQPDFVIIDSRTGISEIAGLCTQQLADEVVMLSSLSSESIKVTRHIKQLIEHSEVALALGKKIEVKVVVSRVPKPDDLDALKKRCCELFDVDEARLFFLFSCPALEREEFIAIATPGKDEELVTNYVRLFYGLNVELASDSIKAEIEEVSRKLLFDPDGAATRIVELVALYPHPDVYRSAMRYYMLTRDSKKMREFGWKILDLTPNDQETQRVLAKSYLQETFVYDDETKRVAVSVIEPLWRRGELNVGEIVRLADWLEDLEHYSRSYDILLPLISEGRLDDETQAEATAIAARSALELGHRDVAATLVEKISVDELGSDLADVAIQLREDAGDFEGAFNIAKQVLSSTFSVTLVERAGVFARQRGRIKELEDTIRGSSYFRRYRTRPGFARELRKLGMSGLAEEIEKATR